MFENTLRLFFSDPWWNSNQGFQEADNGSFARSFSARGLNKSDIFITVNKRANTLTIEANTDLQNNTNSLVDSINYHYHLPNYDLSKIHASLANGVLTVTAPRIDASSSSEEVVAVTIN